MVERKEFHLNKQSHQLSKEKQKLNDLNSESGALVIAISTLPISEEGYRLDKESFWDLIRIRNEFRRVKTSTK